MTITAEIVTFRLAPGAEPDIFRQAAVAMQPFLTRTGGFIRRTLSVDEDGLWTDHILWQSAEDAGRAAQAIMSAPEAAAFMPLIDEASTQMRHAQVSLQQE